MPTPVALNMATKIWLSFIRLVLLIVFFAKTGISAVRQRAQAGLVPRRWLRQLMIARPAFAILAATRPPNYLTPCVLLDWRWQGTRPGFFASAGRLMAQYIQHC
jgi:hypothetical protein